MSSVSPVPGSSWHGHLTVLQAAAAVAAALGLGLLFTLGIYCFYIRKRKRVESEGRTQQSGGHWQNESASQPSPALEEGSQGSERSQRYNIYKVKAADNDPYNSSETPGTLSMPSQMTTNLKHPRADVPETIDMAILEDTLGSSSEVLAAPQHYSVSIGCVACEQPVNPVLLPCLASGPEKNVEAFQESQSFPGLPKITVEKLSLKQKVHKRRLARLLVEQEMPGLPTGPSAASLAWDNSHDAVVTPGPKETRLTSTDSNSQPRAVRQLSTTSQPTSTSSAVSLAWDYTEESEVGLAKTWPVANQGILPIQHTESKLI